jgi:hypothetical protein
VSNASGGRISPHLGRSSGADTGENSEMCAGTRCNAFSRRDSESLSDELEGTVKGGVTAHQVMQALPIIANKAASALLGPITEFALGQKHFITLDEGNCPAKPCKVQCA